VEKLDPDHFEALGPFFHGLTHEIRNPVQGILASTEALRAIFEDDRATMLLNIIQRECIRVNHLLTNLISLSEPIRLSLETQALHMIISESSRLFPNIIVQIDAQLPAIPLDRAAMGLAFRAILQNAAEAQPETNKIHVSASVDGEYVNVVIKDEGTGIPPEDLQQVLQPFFTTRKQHAGLGLTIAERIVKQHKGELVIESEQGKGTVVTIRIPLST
jgi:signal transduction histidine kinase